jgi:hypothetical protein
MGVHPGLRRSASALVSPMLVRRRAVVTLMPATVITALGIG